jgi:integrase
MKGLQRSRSGNYILRFWTNGHQAGSRKVYANLGRVPYDIAIKLAAKKIGADKTRRTSADPRLTFSALADLYLEAESPHLSPRGRALAEMTLRCHLKPFFTSMRVDAIRPADVERFRRQRTCLVGKKVRRKSERPVAASTLNREWSLLRAVLNFGERTERIERNPIRRGAVRLLPVKPRSAFFEPEEWKFFLDAAEADDELRQTVSFWRVLLLTGRRIGELAALRWRDVDIERGTVAFYQTKTARPVTLPLAGEREVLLKALKRFRRIEPEAPVFIHADGSPMTVPFLQVAFRRIARKAALKDAVHGRLTPHTLRHTHATWSRRKGVPLDRIAAVLGHADLRMTMRTYAHIRPDDLAAPLDVLEGMERMARQGKAGSEEEIRGRNGDENPPEAGKLESGFSSMGKS